MLCYGSKIHLSKNYHYVKIVTATHTKQHNPPPPPTKKVRNEKVVMIYNKLVLTVMMSKENCMF